MHEVLTEFVRGLGLTEFRWPDSGLATLAFDRRGTLYLEERPDELLLCLARPLASHQGRAPRLERALRLCHYRHDWPWTVQAGLREPEGLTFVARLPLQEATLPALTQALDLLTRLHERCDEPT